MTLNPQDPLSEQLRSWRVQPPRDPNFRGAVWTQIDAAKRPSSWAVFARGHRALVMVLVASGALIGAWSGRTQARDQIDADRSTLATTYVHQMDARWMRSP